ncbi:MAG: methionine gamma-lyase family protein [Clostridia bacterium]|nr:methionine gamma-lyase family protein [Clostridia bacterium]
MNKETYNYLHEHFGIDAAILTRVEEAEARLASVFSRLDDIRSFNQYKVLDQFQRARINDQHFAWNTGYGYDDVGRTALEQLFADVFGAEAGLVRPTIVNGTHALASVYLGLLRQGDELIYCNGDPYDTMQTVIGLKGNAYGNLREFGVSYKQVDLLDGGKIDIEGVKRAIGPKTKVCALQRSRGYAFRNAMTIPQIEEWAAACKSVKPDVICMVDNCYGEFTDEKEPVGVGADIMAGSLIKNPGGGLALSGGYIVGRRDLVDKVATRVTSPGIGGECGLTFGQTRSMFQGLFIAPRVTMDAVKGAALCAQVFADLGYEVCPGPADPRNDIVEAVRLGSPEAVCAFCEGVQAAAPIDSYVTPVPWDMPGYTDQIIMAAGAFVGGSSIELSADAPMREPHDVFFQGGITYDHARFGVIKALQTLKDRGLVKGL